MNIYDIVMAPVERFFLHRIRAELMSYAKNNVLEVGIGTGVNLKYYNYNQVSALTCLDIDYSAELEREYPNVSFVKGNIEELPFEAETFDCVVSTLVLCSVDIEKSAREILRVLKCGGLFIFIEHVKPSGNFAGIIAETLNPAWSKIANGCNLNRKTDDILQNCGFGKIKMNRQGVFRYGMAEKS